MKKLLTLSLLGVLLLSACSKTQAPPAKPTEPTEPTAPTTPAEPDPNLTLFQNEELIVSLPEGYKGENMNQFSTQITGKDARLVIFKTEGADLTQYDEPQEKLHAGREVYGYDLYLYYANPEAATEIREIAESVHVVQHYRNGAHGITFTFPQDWYFNAENNDRMCMGPFDLGPIREENDSCKGLLNLDLYRTFAEAETAASTLDAPEGGSIWTQDLSGKGLVITLTDSTHLQEAQEILGWTQ